jgi:ParB-like chromosome segregation protein Spo0J
MVVCSQYERVDPKTLHIHPLNESVFGPAETELDQDFMASIRRDGIVTPIAIMPDGKVLSGHRRLAGAIRLELQTVPVVVYRDASEQEQNQIWISSNLQREMTVEQRTRFFMKLRDIEAAAASARQREGVRTKSPQGRSGDIAAEKVGMSRQTATRAVIAVEAIDAAEAAGDTQTAASLRATLEERSINAAFQQAISQPQDDPEPEGDDDSNAVRTFGKSDATRFRAAYQTMIRTIDRGKELEQLTSAKHQNYVSRLQSIVTEWQAEFSDQEWL